MFTPIKNSLLIISILLVFPLYGQNRLEKFSLKWKKISLPDDMTMKSKEVLFFDDAILQKSCSLPCFQRKILFSANSSAVISIIQSIYEPVPECDLGLIDADKISDSIQILQQRCIDRKQEYLNYSFIPIRKNKQSGKFDRLVHFVAKITETQSTHASAKLKSASVVPNESVLNSGDWYKFKISESGVYRLSYNELIYLGLSDPENVRIYGHNGSNLPTVNDGNYPGDPVEIPVMFFNGQDGIFGEGDYILFYAEGPSNIRYNATTKTLSKDLNLYNDQIAYYITSNPGGKRILPEKMIETADTIINTYDYAHFYERNEVNLIQSGREFFSEPFAQQTSYEFTFDLSDLVTSSIVNLTSDMVARSGVNTSFKIYYNSQLQATMPMTAINTWDIIGKYASKNTLSTDISASSGTATIKLEYDKNSDTAAIGWLNSLFINAKKYLKYTSPQLIFRNIQSVKANRTAQFNIENANSRLQVWDISNMNDVKYMNTSITNNILSFNADVSTLKNYIVFDTQEDLKGTSVLLAEKVPNQNLHSLSDIDFLIVTHPKFLSQANELANLHTQNDKLRVKVVTTDEVYNEFSSGNTDLSAIRNYAKYIYDNASSSDNCIKYLLLFGDGTYNNKNADQTFIPTYQSEESLDVINSYISDDYFGILDNSETITGTMDISVGRFPVKTAEEANAVIKKIKAYMSTGKGSWRNQICFLADDEDSNIHMQQADQLANYVKANYPVFNTDKIYLDAYQQVTEDNESRYPDAHSALLNRLNQGTLILNFNGHGSAVGLTHEKVIQQTEDIQKWNNTIYPLFLVLTSNFNRFDMTENSAGEDVLLNGNGGGISIFSAGRITFSGLNYNINYKFYTNLLMKDGNGNNVGIGEIIRKSKNDLGLETYKLSSVLLGDPALKLAFPKYLVQTDSINGKTLSESDTIKANQTVTISGKITDLEGNKIQNFDGTLLPILYGKEKTVSTLANDAGNPFVYKSEKDILQINQTIVKNGEFRFSFKVPEIDSVGNGKLSFYAFNDTTDATGSYSDFILGKKDNTTIDPEIQKSEPKFSCYPNPMQDYTNFCVENNSAFAANITIHIFDMNLRTVNVLKSNNSFISGEKIYWDGTDTQGRKIKAGIYLCKVTVFYKNGKTFTRSHKLVITN